MQTAMFIIGALTLANSAAVIFMLWSRRRHMTIGTEVSRDGGIAMAIRRYDESLCGANLLSRIDRARARLG